jgi:hypothetical protein
MRYCDARGLPPITALIVAKDVGRPGSGLTTLGPNPDKQRERVFKHEWFKSAPLTSAELEAFTNRNSKSA